MSDLGDLPPQLADLPNLRHLDLNVSGLTGEIPRELGNLGALEYLFLEHNRLRGAIPSTLANLSNLRYLTLSHNKRLTGAIPEELGSLTKLNWLLLNDNQLNGTIPPTLRNIENLRFLGLSNNLLEGPLPAELPSSMASLSLQNNAFSGTVPPSWGNLQNLSWLTLHGNPELKGPLPESLTSIPALRTLSVAGTGVCAPAEASFLAWLAAIRDQHVPLCSRSFEPYLIQAAQSPDFPVPLVAGEEALLRVFVASPSATSETLPPVRATFFVNGAQVHVAEIPSSSSRIPAEVREGELGLSANVAVPGRVIQPGLEMVVEVDPDGTLDPSLGVSRRIPASGRKAVEVRAMPTLDLTAVPIVSERDVDGGFIRSVQELRSDHELMDLTHTLMPIEEIDFEVRAPLILSDDIFRSPFTTLTALEAARVADGAPGHYMGFPKGGAGVAQLGGRSSLVSLSARTMAHELGHNFDLAHAPCGRNDSLDPLYPYEGGVTGVWGYDFASNSLVTPFAGDIMGGGCQPQWISDYHFKRAMRFRVEEDGQGAAHTARKTLLVWGGTDSTGNPVLHPSFVQDAPPVLPAEDDGPFRIVGRDSSGATLFSISFDLPEFADGDGSRGFAFALPVQPRWESSLASITLAGPDGSTVLDRESNLPMAILRDPRTGQVRGFLRDPPAMAQAAADAALPGAPALEVLFSRGIPDAAAWRR